MRKMYFFGLFFWFLPLLTTAQIVLVQDTFHYDRFQFDLILENTSEETIILDIVGIKSTYQQDLICLGGFPEIKVMVDYPVPFMVLHEETLLTAEPKLAVPPHQQIRLTITAIPDPKGTCGYWESDISAILGFDTYQKLYSPSATINSIQTYFFLLKYLDEKQQPPPRPSEPPRQPESAEILEMITSNDYHNQIKGILRIEKAGLDTQEVNRLLEDKLQNGEKWMPAIAAEKAGELGIFELAGEIRARLQRSKNCELIASYCEALAALEGEQAVELILSKILNTELLRQDQISRDCLEKMKEALKAIASPKVKTQVKLALEESLPDTTNSDDIHIVRLAALAEVLIGHQDTSSIGTVLQVLDQLQEQDWLSLSAMAKITDFLQMQYDQTNEEPTAMMIGLQPWYHKLTQSGYWFLRENGYVLLAMAEGNKSDLADVLQRGLNDPEASIKMTIAKWIGIRQLQALAPALQEMLARAPSWEEGYAYCQALLALGRSCNSE